MVSHQLPAMANIFWPGGGDQFLEARILAQRFEPSRSNAGVRGQLMCAWAPSFFLPPVNDNFRLALIALAKPSSLKKR
jgi:hypothetical protein